MTESSHHAPGPDPAPRRVVIQLLILVGLTAAIYFRELAEIVSAGLNKEQKAHALVAPLLIAILLVRRRPLLAAALRSGSWWGLVPVLLGLGVKAAATWPFNFALPQRLSMVLVLIGAIATVAGWRVLRPALPMLAILVLAIPLGGRPHAVLTRGLEQLTMDAGVVVLEMLPGVTAEFDGPDLLLTTIDGAGAVALGEPDRWVNLLFASLTITVFVAFVRIRPLWQLGTLAIAAIPIAALANFGRLMVWCGATLYGGATPTSAWPRAAAAVTSLVLAYALSAGLAFVLSRLLTDTAGEGG